MSNNEKQLVLDEATKATRAYMETSKLDVLRPVFDVSSHPDAGNKVVHLVNNKGFSFAFVNNLKRTCGVKSLPQIIGKLVDALNLIDSKKYSYIPTNGRVLSQVEKDDTMSGAIAAIDDYLVKKKPHVLCPFFDVENNAEAEKRAKSLIKGSSFTSGFRKKLGQRRMENDVLTDIIGGLMEVSPDRYKDFKGV